MKKILLATALVVLLAGMGPLNVLAQALDFGDAPEGALAYPSSGQFGFFPTCLGGPSSWIQHTNFGAWFGPGVDFEPDGNGGLCPSFVPYDQDECFMDGDAGLLLPQAYTITGPAGAEVVVPCPLTQAPPALGLTCQTAVWGGNIDIDLDNHMPNHPPYLPGYVNVLIDWNQDGMWGGSSPCPPAGTPAPEHVLVDFLVPPLFIGPLSALLPPPFLIGPNPGYVWVRFSITEGPVGPDWDGHGGFEDGESEDYLLLVNQEDELTIFPVAQTECPEIQTECPVIDTQCPTVVEPTTCPVIETQCVEQPAETVCPELPTWCPENPTSPTQCQITECPDDPTWCSVDPTWCPVDIPTVCPEIFTECPVVETMCGGQVGDLTTCSQAPTFCDTGQTVCPLDPTFCALSTTFCPFAWTLCPGGFTLCPEIPTVCPDSTPTVCKVTLCPEDHTLCATDVFTACPLEPTYCELEPTFCNQITECSFPLTLCQILPGGCEPTIFPDIPTECPTRWTFCPEAPTWCPVIYTYCPDDNPTLCSITDPTNCPLDFTWCPEEPTECPQLDTFCPEGIPGLCEITVYPITDTLCPVEPTTCPLVDSDGDGIDDCNDNCPTIPNGPSGGTCTIGATIGEPCMSDIECDKGITTGFCSKNQEDTRPPGGNGCGDACECEADLTGEGTVGVDDTLIYLGDLPRNPWSGRPCTNDDPCLGDLDCDGTVGVDDTLLYLEDLPRNDWSLPPKYPCPQCSRNGYPCAY